MSLFGIGAALLGGMFSSNSASRGVEAQVKAAREQIAFQKETRDLITERVDPWFQSGQTANQVQNHLLGFGEAPEGYTGFQASPGYQYQFDQGMAAVNALAGARGGLDSGATLQALQDRGTQLANQDFYNHLAAVSGAAGQGLNAAGLQATAATNAATGVSNALTNIGNAQSAGATAQGNIFNNTLGDISGLWQYQRQSNPGFFPNAPSWL